MWKVWKQIFCFYRNLSFVLIITVNVLTQNPHLFHYMQPCFPLTTKSHQLNQPECSKNKVDSNCNPGPPAGFSCSPPDSEGFPTTPCGIEHKHFKNDVFMLTKWCQEQPSGWDIVLSKFQSQWNFWSCELCCLKRSWSHQSLRSFPSILYTWTV